MTTCNGPQALSVAAAPERARTAATRAAAAVCVAGRDPSRPLAHATTATGQVLVLVPADGEVAATLHRAPDRDVSALLMVSDRSPVPLRDPVRAQVWLSGWLTPVAAPDARAAAVAFAEVAPVGALLDVGRGTTLLSLDLAEVVLGECGTVTELQPEDYLAAAPDPLVGLEAAALQHLDAAHPEELALLRTRVPRRAAADDVVRPLGLDRYGFRLRIEQRRGHADVRVPFVEPVSDPEQLGAAVHRLMCAARRVCPER